MSTTSTATTDHLSANRGRNGTQACGPVIVALFVAFLAFAPFSALAETLSVYAPVVKRVEDHKPRYAYDVNRVTSGEARALADFVGKKFGLSSFPIVYRIPGKGAYYLVSLISSRGGEPLDYGRRFALITRSSGGYQIHTLTRGAADSYILQPHFYIGRRSVFILAEEGTEYYWGISVYRFTPATGRLAELGMLDVAKPNGVEDPVAPFSDLEVVDAGPRTEFRFYGDEILHSGTKDERYLRRKGRYISFVLEHGPIRLDESTVLTSPRQ